MKAANLFLLVAVLQMAALLGGCGGPSTRPGSAPPPPPKAAPVRGDVVAAREAVGRATEDNHKIAATVSTLRGELARVREDSLTAMQQAESIRLKAEAQELIAESEVASMIRQMQKVEARNLFLETEAGRLEGTVQEQAVALLDGEIRVKEVEEKVIDLEGEVATHRAQRAQMEREIGGANERADAYQKQAVKAAADANFERGSASFYRWGFYILASVGLIYLLLKLKGLVP